MPRSTHTPAKAATLTLLAALCMAGAGVGHAQAPGPIKIGYLNTFSGPIGQIGQDMYDGFMLGIKQKGGKLGGVPIELVKLDDQFKPEVATQMVSKLIEKENVPIITGLAGSNVIMAVQKQIVDKQVFLIGANAGPSPLAGAMCSPYQFITSWQNDSWAEAAGQYASDKGYKKVVLVASNYQAGKDAVKGFKRLYKGTVVNEVYPALDVLDYSAELTPIAADKPDAVFAFIPGGAVNFTKQYQQMGLVKSVPLLTVGMMDGNTLSALRDSALGVQSVHFWAPDTDNAVSRKFVDDFEESFKRIPSNQAAQGYDTALLLDSAIAKVKGNVADKPAFMAALKEGVANSVRGRLRFDNNNFPINDWYAFEVAKDAKGRVNLKTVATPLKDYHDSYHAQCPMK